MERIGNEAAGQSHTGSCGLVVGGARPLARASRIVFGEPGCADHLQRLHAEYARRTGYTYRGHRAWPDAELNLLDALYPDYAALQRALPHRSLKALQKKVEYRGIARKRFIWTSAEVARIRRPYASGVPINDVAALVPGKSKQQIYARAHRSRIRRPARPPAPTLFPVVDAIRRRAFDLNMSIRDLNELVGARSYFNSPRYLSWRFVGRAIEALEGDVEVRWRD